MTAAICVALIVLVILLVCVFRTAANKPVKTTRAAMNKHEIDNAAIAEKLGGAVRIPTVCYDNEADRDYSQWAVLHEYLEDQFPLMHQHMELEKLNNGLALLYRWRGRNSDKLPILLMAHMDVVPVADGTLGDWRYPPFSGEVAEGCVWGRGCVDMKGSLIAIAQACESLLEDGFVPDRDVYISFGHDEETPTDSGALNTAKLLEARGVRFEFVLDEGGMMLDGEKLGISGKVAALGISEKGYLDVIVSAKGNGGHSSTPPDKTALCTMAEAVAAISNKPMKARFDGPAKELYLAAAPYMSFWSRLLYSNLWLFSPLIVHRMKKTPKDAALVRTTFAPTQAGGSKAPNVLPDDAWAIINVRIAPWDDRERVLEHMRRSAGSSVELSCGLFSAPSMVADVRGQAYTYVSSIVGSTFEDLRVVPCPMLAATDSRYFTGICDNVIRFVPFRSYEQGISTMHGVNEFVEVDSLAEGATFFVNIIENLNKYDAISRRN